MTHRQEAAAHFVAHDLSSNALGKQLLRFAFSSSNDFAYLGFRLQNAEYRAVDPVLVDPTARWWTPPIFLAEVSGLSSELA